MSEEARDEFERRVRERAALLTQAQKVAPNVVIDSNMSDDEVRAKAVAYVRGYSAIEGRTADYIAGLFDHLAEQQPVDPVRLALIARGNRHH